MASYTLAQLRTQVRSLADIENDGHKADSEITTWINQGAQELHDELVAANEDHHTTSVEFTLSSSTGNTYSLPANFQAVRGVDFSESGVWLRVPEFSFAERDRYDEDLYEGTFRLWYVLRFTPLVADADELDDHISEYAVSFAARKARIKEESDTRELDADLLRLRARAMRMFAKRNRGGGRVIADVRRGWSAANDGPWRSDIYTQPESRLRRFRVIQNAVYIVGRGVY